MLGTVLVVATLAGLAVLSLQIAANDGSLASAKEHILDRLDRRAFGDPKDYRGPMAESLSASTRTVLQMYLNINAFNTQTPPRPWQAVYWQLIALFAIFTVIFLLKYGMARRGAFPITGLALMVSTWFSIAAPLSWYVIFRPTSYVHTFLFPMAWQMPFVLLGFALCGYVIQNLFSAKQR